MSYYLIGVILYYTQDFTYKTAGAAHCICEPFETNVWEEIDRGWSDASENEDGWRGY